MAATMDFYSSSPLRSSVPFGGELMEALEPFKKIPTQTQPSSSYPDGCSTSMTHMFSDGFLTQNLIGFEQPRSIGLNQLTPSQIHQIHLQNQHFYSQNQQPQHGSCSSNTLSFLSPKPIPVKQAGSPPKPSKLYRVVRRGEV
ncbi:ethylene-responsive transcription factor erf060 [Quercus suber]|uniref:Ethylene-responsive transcription factor erf060 n=1 Tax=Quercus suber TaxID=58331 RepID=A0AAW0LPA1_QUESU